jgi:hypothetical protein
MYVPKVEMSLSTNMNSKVRPNLMDNYIILRKYIKCILSPLTEVVGPVN